MKCPSCNKTISININKVSPNRSFIICDYCGIYIPKNKVIKKLESEKESLCSCLQNLALDINEIRVYQAAIEGVDRQIKILKGEINNSCRSYTTEYKKAASKKSYIKHKKERIKSALNYYYTLNEEERKARNRVAYKKRKLKNNKI